MNPFAPLTVHEGDVISGAAVSFDNEHHRFNALNDTDLPFSGTIEYDPDPDTRRKYKITVDGRVVEWYAEWRTVIEWMIRTRQTHHITVTDLAD